MAALSDDAVATRGYVRVDRLERGIRIELEPDALSQAAYVEVMHWLDDQPESRVYLSTDAGPGGECIVGVTELKRQLAEYVKAARMRTEKRLKRAPIPVSALGASNPLRGFRQLWEYGIDPSDRDFANACDRHFHGSYTLSEAVATGDLIIRMSGRGYVIYKDTYLSRCVGLRLEDDPDLEYGLWIKNAHLEALKSQRPLIEDVSVTFRGAGEAERRVSYQRIIAPLRDKHGRNLLLSASVRTSIPPA